MTETIGPYELQDFIAKGGMGEVYHATHRSTGTPVAIKLISSSVLRTPAIREEFLREVQSSASLEHPAIISVYDYGEVTAAEDLRSDRLHEGTPWFAMEFATLGSLANTRTVPKWRVVRRVIYDILDALAHAHARGLIHRDLKPANILVTERETGVAIVLADFGIAHPVELSRFGPRKTADIVAPSAGTPSYMAPEQINAEWRRMGPWTDLYALGCLAWEIVTGSPPFDGESSLDVMIQHVGSAPPAFEPAFDVPDGLEQWLQRLIRKVPRERFQRAADAAWALEQLDTLVDDPEATDDDSAIARLATAPASAHTLLEADPTQRLPESALDVLRAADATRSGEPAPVEAPPPPIDWRGPPRESWRGARPGLGLFGLREVPLVDREPERDRIWELILSAITEGKIQAMAIEAGPGFGKSTLLRWAAVRTHELGVATVLRTNHAELGSLQDGLPTMLARHLGCFGLPRPKAYKHIEHYLETIGVEHRGPLAAALTQIVAPADPEKPDPVPAVLFGSPTERYVTIEHFLRAEARRRPVLLTIDDAQWGGDSLAFVDHLRNVNSRNPFPLAILMAVNTVGLQERALETLRVQGLKSTEAVATLKIGPLPPAAHLELVDEMLGLDEDLSAELVEAAGGDPMFSVTAIGDWVQRDVMIPGPTGYRFPAGTDFDLPESAIDICEARFDRIAAQFALPARCRHVLQIAGALGNQVDRDEWLAVCRKRGVRPPQKMLQTLVDTGLVEHTDGGFRFPHQVMVDALRRAAEREGRERSIFADCAKCLARTTEDGGRTAERKARYLLRAGLEIDALRDFATAANSRMSSSAYEEAIHLADTYLDLAWGNQLDPMADSTVRMLSLRAEAYRFIGDTERSRDLAEELRNAADRSHSTLARAEALRVLAGLQQRLGDDETGIALYDQASALFGSIGDGKGEAKCAHGRGWLNVNLGRFEEAILAFHSSASLSGSLDSPLDEAWALQGLAEAALYMGSLERAETSAARALELFREVGSRSGEGMALTSVGNTHRAHGRAREARSFYRAAINLLSSFDSPLSAFPMLHTIWLELDQGDHERLGVALARVPAAARTAMPAGFQIAYRLAETYFLVVSGEPVQPTLLALDTLVQGGRGTHPMVPAILGEVEKQLARRDPALGERLHQTLAPLLTHMGIG